MTNASRTLLALAAIAPLAYALDVKDDDLKLGLKLQLQVRAEKSVSRDVTDSSFNATEGVAGQPDDAEFYLRRARIGFAGSYKNDYKFAYVLRNDDQDKAGTTARGPVTNVAYIERIIKQDSLGLEHSLKMGLDYAYFNGASAVFASTALLFPSVRATSVMLAPRGTGVAYKVSTQKVTVGVDVQNNTGDDAGLAGNTKQGEGLFYGIRAQAVAYDSDAKGHMKPVESFLGKEGKGVLVTAEYGINQNDNTSATATANTKGYGVEVLAHANAVTGLAEWRQTVTSTGNKTTADTRTVATAYLAQVGYALSPAALGGQVIEPAMRLTHVNAVGGTTESTNYSNEFGSSGNSVDLGVNYYINGHSNKTQLAFQHWKGEDTAKAEIVRFQWQLAF